MPPFLFVFNKKPWVDWSVLALFKVWMRNLIIDGMLSGTGVRGEDAGDISIPESSGFRLPWLE